ncbi:MAG TPA: hypothetical protein VIO32_09070 [Candidatus Baltobacteraceae bacterium]
MRVEHKVLAAFCCAALLSGCGGADGTVPAGVTIVRHAGYSGTLSDMASQITTDTLLRNRGAKLLEAQPYRPCPGEAGLQTFALQGGRTLLQVAFTQWTGTAVTASYRRPAKAPEDPKAADALRRAVCSSAFGG